MRDRQCWYLNDKGILTTYPKTPNIFLGFQNRYNFKIEYKKGVCKNTRTGERWFFKPWDDYKSLLKAQTLVALPEDRDTLLNNVPTTIWPGTGHGYAAVKDGIVMAAVLLTDLPDRDHDFIGDDRYRKTIEFLSEFGTPYFGRFEESQFIQATSMQSTLDSQVAAKLKAHNEQVTS